MGVVVAGRFQRPRSPQGIAEDDGLPGQRPGLVPGGQVFLHGFPEMGRYQGHVLAHEQGGVLAFRGTVADGVRHQDGVSAHGRQAFDGEAPHRTGQVFLLADGGYFDGPPHAARLRIGHEPGGDHFLPVRILRPVQQGHETDIPAHLSRHLEYGSVTVGIETGAEFGQQGVKLGRRRKPVLGRSRDQPFLGWDREGKRYQKQDKKEAFFHGLRD